MNKQRLLRHKRSHLTERNFPSAGEDAALVSVGPSPYDQPGSSYKLAFTDTEFILREEMRAVRMQLELLKPELIQTEHGIESTIVIFGSARILPRDVAEQRVAEAIAKEDDAAVKRARMQVEMSHYYEEARRFATLVTRATCAADAPLVVVTGGGPGIMEAGNRGAFEAQGKSIGLNIVLQHEQQPNPYITPELCFQFHYFALRKMHFLMRSVALVCFPGGFGTLDELFEVLTLTQARKVRRRPILLFGEAFWRKLVNFDHLVETGMISPEDVHLFHFVETAEQAWEVLSRAFDLENAAEADAEEAAE
ncbi:MAG: TIGR00730 family Rossman fold protein [Burkholderiaceae bacterium]|nr:TIGR00730 family Rossman fold protein [Burkholderiaceae bacterium]